jgi:ubiquinone/menaquinone biosynthesis C-methylase UbiE
MNIETDIIDNAIDEFFEEKFTKSNTTEQIKQHEQSEIIFKNNVVDAYDKIASDFSRTRYKAWPHTIDFVNSLDDGMKVCEFGCGNGKNFVRDTIEWYGIDTSQGLVDICKDRGFENVILCNGTETPYKDESFDAIMSIAVIHHLPSYKERVEFLREMIRVCKSSESNNIILEAWATDAKKYETSEIVGNDIDEYSHNDRYVTFAYGNEKAKRFYHFYDRDEFEKLIGEFEELDGVIEHSMHNFIFIGKVQH